MVGLGITQLVDGVMWAIGDEVGGEAVLIAQIIRLFPNLLLIITFAGFSFLARGRHRWAFIVGMILYALDMLILVLVADIFSIIFHLIGLFGLFTGFRALGELKRIESGAIASQPAWLR